MTCNGTEQDIIEELRGIPTIDTHEHLPPENERLKNPADFYTLFEHYCQGDLVSAGATEKDMAFIADRKLPLTERWQRFKPFFSSIRTGSYARVARIVIRELLGFDELSDETYEGISVKLQEINKPGLYDKILREHCNITTCIECWQVGKHPFPKYFCHLAMSGQVLDLVNQKAVKNLSEKYNHSIHTLDDALTCTTKIVDDWRADPGVVGIKCGHAYHRSLSFQKVTKHDAETIFNRILISEEHTLSAHEVITLQDFLMFELLARADAVHLPMVFHTGLQAGNYNRITNANPLLLESLIKEFPRAKIDLFHGGMPWVREIAVLAKYFPGVHLNMAWMHIISPVQARSALSEWLDMVPNTKIFGFGGDFKIVEKVYGHLVIARQNIAAVLADKIESGVMSRADASLVARRLMSDNPRDFYKLPG